MVTSTAPFTERLRGLGLGTTQIARLIGTSPQYVSQVIHGRRPPSLILRGFVDMLEERRERAAVDQISGDEARGS